MTTQTLSASSPAPPPRWPRWRVPRPGWRRTLLFLLLIGAPAAIIVHLISAYGVDVPFWDEWENAQLFTASRHEHRSLLELARQQNESRLLIPNLCFLLLSLPGSWSVVRAMYLEVALVLGVCAVVFQLLRRTGFSLPVQSGLLFAVGWLLFSLTQQENWFFGIQICYYLVPASLCLALWINVTGRPLAWKTFFSLGAAFVAAYSFSGGVLVFPLAFPGLLPANWSAAGGWRPDRRELAWHAAYVAGSAALLTAYFWGYSQPGGQGTLLYLAVHAGEPLRYFLAWLGSPLFPREPAWHAIGAGAGVCGLLAALLAACVRPLRDRGEQRRLYPWIVLAAYALGTGAMTVLGRSIYGVHQALSSRYISFSSYAYVAILVLGTYLWCFHRPRVPAGLRLVLLGAAAGLLAAAGVSFVRAQVDTMPWIRDSYQQRAFAAQGLSFLPLMPTSQNLDTLCGIPELLRLRAMDLLRRRVLTLPVAPLSLRGDLQAMTREGDPAYGGLDQPDMNPDGRVSIRGWAVDPARKQPAGRVLITATPPGGATQPLVVFLTHLYRPPLAPARGMYQKMPCAFVGVANFDRLAPGDYRVAAWQVDDDLRHVHQIGSTYPFHWARSGVPAHPLGSFVFPPLDPAQSPINGVLEAARLGADGRLEVSGWAINVNYNLPPKAVLITCTDAAGTTRIAGHAGPGQERRDVANSYHNDALTYCGFYWQSGLGGLPPGIYRVAAWTVGDTADGEPLVQLTGIFPVQVHPR